MMTLAGKYALFSGSKQLKRDESEELLPAGKQPARRWISPDDVAARIMSQRPLKPRDITRAAIPIDGDWFAL